MTVPTVAILLSAYNGAPYLHEQLASLEAQSLTTWRLFWRDDGSDDDSVAILDAFTATHPDRCERLAGDVRGGSTASYLALLRHAVATSGCEAFAFADQDDVWLPDKLARAAAALSAAQGPALYCARQTLVDARLRRIGVSPRLRHPPCFAAALAQNIATGCTVVLNAPAGRRVAASWPPPGTWHDWWSYLVVTAGGGTVLFDDTQVVLYRQHKGNAVGAPISPVRRGMLAARRGHARFMRLFRGHSTALLAQPALVNADALVLLTEITAALGRSRAARLRALSRPGLRRQGWAETAVFRTWFLLG